ncbi:MAG: aspartate/glutamate racemase family protein [Gaiellaceae bacterium]
MFRLGLLNPNTDSRQTEAMGAVAREALGPGCDVVGVTAARGPSSIESAADEAVAGAQVVEMVRSTPDCDAYVIACFGDPGLHAAREVTEAPVVGVGEAAYRAACLVSRRFAVVTTLPRGIPELEDAAEQEGIARRCVGVFPVHIPVQEQGAANPDAVEAIVAAGRLAMEERRAEALVLACGAMADVARQVSGALGIPVCDGVSFGALLAYALWRSGLRTSKVGAYHGPEPIPYLGMAPLAALDGS